MTNITEVWLGDALDSMRTAPDKSVDFVFFDPPYNVGKDYGVYKDNLPHQEYRQWMEDCISEATRISKRGVAVYVSGKLTRLFSQLMPDAHLIVVHKRAIGVRQGKYTLQYHSLFATAKPLVACKDVWNDIRLPGEGFFFREPRYANPGLTSLALTERVIDTFTEKGEIVFDPFMGTGTTAVACIELDRICRGVELNPAYLQIAHQRISAVEPKKDAS
jgi:site-specific DNA-methyltransferase (adenine-specific)